MNLHATPADFGRGVRLQQAPPVLGVRELHDTGHPQVPSSSQLGRVRQVHFKACFLPGTH